MGAGTSIDEMLLSVIAPWRGDMLSEPLSAEAASLLIEQFCDVPWRDPVAGVASHPQIMLTTPMEARLQPADCVILAGLNENVWPCTSKLVAESIYASAFGLPTQEHELSLQSHDFMTLASYPKAYLIRSERQPAEGDECKPMVAACGVDGDA